MAETLPDGMGYVLAGTGLGTATAISIGNVGLVGALGGVAVGAIPIIGTGAVAGAAVYGTVQGIREGEPVAFGAIGLGMVGGATVSATIGGIGVAGSFGAFGLGMGAMASLGGVVGLGIYGVVKMLDQGVKETPAQVFDRMEEKIAWQEAYIAALIELDDLLTGNDIKRKFIALETEDELDRLKAESQRQKAYKTGMTAIQPTTIPANATLNLPIASSSEVSSSNVWLCTHTLKHQVGAINSIAMSPDSQTAIVGGDDCHVYLIDIKTGNRLFSIAGREPVLSVAIHPKGQSLVYGGLDQVISHWKVDPKIFLNSFLESGTPHSHRSFVYSLAFTPNGNTLVSGSADQTIRIWNYDDRSFVKKLRRTLKGHTDTVFSVAVSPDGNTIISGSADRTLRIWDLMSWAKPRILQGHTGAVNAVAIHPNGQTIASGSNDRTVRLWDWKTGELLAVLTGHSEPVTDVLFSPKGGTLISGSKDGTIRFWQRDEDRSWKCLYVLPGHGPIAIAPDGKTLVSSSRNHEIKVWKLRRLSA
ncbi:hypothetical protein [Egbenema bharatensis]|uniref:hypothetical protein n=1 Tax=Egbenema bharatensis TaxID=3463334 RepID=UPI003A852FED